LWTRSIIENKAADIFGRIEIKPFNLLPYVNLALSPLPNENFLYKLLRI
jgi:hypothetical protein